MTHCGTFQFDDLLVSCVTEIIQNGFESALIPEVIQAWICKKLVHSRVAKPRRRQIKK